MAEHDEEVAGVSLFTDRQRDLWNAAIKIIADRGSLESSVISNDRSSVHFRAISLALRFDFFADDCDGMRRSWVEIRQEECVLFSAAVAPIPISASTMISSAAVMMQAAGSWEARLLEAAEHLPAPGPMEVVFNLTDREE